MRRSLVFLALAACAKSGSSAVVNGPVEDCNDVINALADAYARCGNDRDAAAEGQLAAIADGRCATITGVRDHDSLSRVCIPSLAALPCAALEAGTIDESCKRQLQKPVRVVDASADAATN